MGTRTRKRKVEEDFEGEVEGENEDTTQGSVEESDSMFEGMKDDDYVLLFRRDEGTKAFVFHGRLAPSEANEYTISMKYGGGEYLGKERTRLASGRKGFGRQRTIFIAGKYKNPVDQADAPAAPAGGEPSAIDKMAGGVNMEDVKMAGVLSLLQMTQQAAQTQATMQQQMQQMMMQSMTAQREGMQALVEMASKREAAPVADPMEMFKMMMDMTKGAQSPKSEIKEMVEAMSSILAFRDDMMPAAPVTGNPLMDSVPKVLELVQQGFDMKKLEHEGGKVPTVKTQANIPPAPPTGAPEIQVPLWQQVLRAQKSALVKAAAAGKDTQIAALAAVEFMPEGIRGAMVEFVRREDLLEQVYVVAPELRDYPKWTHDFFAEAREQLLSGDEEGEDTTGGNDDEEANEADASETP